MVLGVRRKHGAVWKAVSGIRTRWNIEAQAQIPRSISPGGWYVPPGFPEEPKLGDDGYEEWADRLSQWTGEMIALYKSAVPEDCRESVGSDLLSWLKFLSALVNFDPPVPGLAEFRDALDAPRVLNRPMPAPKAPEYWMVAPPINWVRDTEKAVEAQRKFYRRIIDALMERFVVPQGLDTEEVLDDIMQSTPGLLEELQEAEAENPPRPVIEPKPYHTEQDTRNATQMLRATHQDLPNTGRPKRDRLIAAECAILADHYGWKHREIAEQVLKPHGLTVDEHLAGEYVKTGRKVLREAS